MFLHGSGAIAQVDIWQHYDNLPTLDIAKWLLDDAGRVLVSSEEKGRKSALSMSGNKTKALGVLGIPELETHARKGTTSGFVVDDSDVLVFARFKALPWILVARVDALLHDL